MAYFGVFEIFSLWFEHSDKPLVKVTSFLKLPSLFWIYDALDKFVPSALYFGGLAGRKYQQYPWNQIQLEKMNFAMKMSNVRLSSSYHKYLCLRCVFQSVCDRFEDILVFHG